jgi:thioredoxin-like negative regulator of GroEL
LQITALPTIVAFKNGKEVDRFLGMRDEAGIKKFIQKLL